MNVVSLTKLYRLLLAGIVLVSISAAGVATAAEPTNEEPREEITISPVRKQHEVDPSSSLNSAFKVINNGNVPYDFIVYARPFSVKDRTYEQDFQSVTARANAYSWVQFEQTEYTIEPGETIEVRYNLRVPEDAIPGGQYGILFAETVPSDTEGQSVVRKKRVGSILQLRVSGDIVEQGRALDSTIDFLQFRPPLTATTSIENTGTVDFDANVTLTTKDAFGNIIFSEKRPYTVYPDTTRDVTFDWEDAKWFGLYNVSVETEVGDTATETSNYVLMAPRWLLIALVLGLIGGGYATFRRRK